MLFLFKIFYITLIFLLYLNWNFLQSKINLKKKQVEIKHKSPESKPFKIQI